MVNGKTQVLFDLMVFTTHSEVTKGTNERATIVQANLFMLGDFFGFFCIGLELVSTEGGKTTKKELVLDNSWSRC